MLGCLKELYPELDGVTPAAPNLNTDNDGTVYLQSVTQERQMPLDPHHEVQWVAEQLAGGNGGFVKNFSKMYPDSKPEDRQFVMGYYPVDFLPGFISWPGILRSAINGTHRCPVRLGRTVSWRSPEPPRAR